MKRFDPPETINVTQEDILAARRIRNEEDDDANPITVAAARLTTPRCFISSHSGDGYDPNDPLCIAWCEENDCKPHEHLIHREYLSFDGWSHAYLDDDASAWLQDFFNRDDHLDEITLTRHWDEDDKEWFYETS